MDFEFVFFFKVWFHLRGKKSDGVQDLIILGFKDMEEEMGLKFKEGKILIVAVEDWRQVKWS